MLGLQNTPSFFQDRKIMRERVRNLKSFIKRIDEKLFFNLFRLVYLFFLSIGFNPKKIFFTIRNLPRYIFELFKFKKMGGTVSHKYMILNDYKDKAGILSGHYFHQDLLVAKYIYENKPHNHIDIGSRIDGFVAHVASFRPIKIMDIRDLEKSEHQNIEFIKRDLMNNNSIYKKITDSISCLHAIEHFGLGRYGDRIDPNGHIKGFNNIIKMLKKNGTLYISFPIGKKNEVHFNAHRVFHPKEIFNWYDKKDLSLKKFDMVADNGKLYKNIDINKHQFNLSYGCGIYTFIKTS
jgi:hypothetical protein